MNILVITHNDLDGAGSAAVVKVCHPNDTLNFIPTAHDVLDDLTEVAFTSLRESAIDLLIFTDISPSLSRIQQIRDENLEVIILDHHKHSDWADPEARVGVRGAYGVERCGTTLAAAYFDKDSLLFQDVLNAIEAWDLWKLEDPLRGKGESLNKLHSLIGTVRMREYLQDVLTGTASLEVSWVLDCALQHDKSYARKRADAAVIETDSEGNTYAVTHVGRAELNGNVGGILATKDTYAMLLNPEEGTISLRSVNEGVDVGRIAKQRGGGGHHNAAGYPLK